MKIDTKSLQAKLTTAMAVTPRKVKHTAAQKHTVPIVSGHGRIAKPVTFTLNDGDMQRIDTIRDLMRANGARNISASEAVKLALRAVKPGNDLVKLYEGVKADDGRRTKS